MALNFLTVPSGNCVAMAIGSSPSHPPVAACTGIATDVDADAKTSCDELERDGVPRLYKRSRMDWGRFIAAYIQMELAQAKNHCYRLRYSVQVFLPRLSEYFNFRAFMGNMKQVLAGCNSRDSKSDAVATQNPDPTSINVPHEATTWFVSSAAVNHLTGNLNILTGYTPTSGDHPIHVPHIGPMRVHGSGSVNTPNVTLLNVWYVPGLEMNLVSAGQLTKLGYNVSFDSYGCLICSGTDDSAVGKARFTDEFQFEVEFIKLTN